MEYEPVSKKDPICQHCRMGFYNHANGQCRHPEKDLANYRVFINDGKDGMLDLKNLSDLEFIASQSLKTMTPLGQETSVTLRVTRLKKS